jgi:iron(III) transport system substrate-binding protein
MQLWLQVRWHIPTLVAYLAWVTACLSTTTGRAIAAEPGSRGKVVVYSSQDQVYAEPILQQFERQTTLRVLAVNDSEAVKTVGLANRLLAERAHPQCDVFWNNEELRTRQLAAQGVLRESRPWAAIGYRSRRLVINTNRLSPAAAPKSLVELTNQAWRGKVALAYPLFGTTGTHFLALR